MKLNKSILLYPFVLAPILAIFVTMFLNNGFYNVLTAYVWLVVAFVIFDRLGKYQKIEFPKYLKYLLLFVLYTIVSDYFLADKTINVKYFYTNYLISGFLAALLAENINVSQSFIQRASRFSISLLIFAFLLILYQQIVDEMFLVNIDSLNATTNINKLDNIQRRLPSIYSWTSLMDVNYGFIGLITLIISKILLERKKDNTILILISMTLVFSFLTRARWIMLNAFLVLIMYFYYKGINIKNLILYGLITVVVIFSSIRVMEYANIPITKIINERILENDKSNIEKTSAGTRIFAFYTFIKLFPEHPVFGKGMLHSFGGHSKDIELVHALGGKSSQIHVGYLSLLYYYGIVGAFPWLMFLFFLLKKLYLEAKESKFYGAFFVVFGFMLSNWTLVNHTIFYYGLILALVFHKYYMDKYKFDQKQLQLIRN